MKAQKIEGYWGDIRHKEKRIKYGLKIDSYPIPIPSELSEHDAKIIYLLIKKLEKKCGRISYKGSSYSRITGEGLGSSEFQNKDWLFPEDLASHYVLRHRVKPSYQFLKYIGFYQ